MDTTIQEQKSIIRGYVGTILNNGTKKYIKFGGGLTNNPNKANIYSTIDETLTAGELYRTNHNILVGAAAINGLGEIA